MAPETTEEQRTAGHRCNLGASEMKTPDLQKRIGG